jgi:hypothetical protein
MESVTEERQPLVFPHLKAPHDLEPLQHSHEDSDYEKELKEIFLELFESKIRAPFERVNTYGMAHVGDFDSVERFTKQDGVAAYRIVGKEAYIRELYRGWKSRNPRRGLHFLRFYLQCIFPNRWTCDQLWQNPANTYPTNTSKTERAGDFLTSRVVVSVYSGGVIDSQVLSLIAPSMRSVIPARLLLLIQILNTFESNLVVGGVCSYGETSFCTGSFSFPEINAATNIGLGLAAFGSATSPYEGHW